MVDNYKNQFARSKAFGAKYMVFHVMHVRLEDTFTKTYDYTDEAIIEATIELVNEAFGTEAGWPKLLFENLWWPGLTFTRPEILKRLLEGVKYPEIGCVLDVSHLTITNPTIKNEQQCYQYIKKIVEDLGDMAKMIETVHLNKTLPRDLFSRDQSFLLERYRKATTKQQKDKIIIDYVHKLDPHQPFDHEVAGKILAYIKPKYCVYETNPSSIYEMAHFMIRQNKVL